MPRLIDADREIARLDRKMRAPEIDPVDYMAAHQARVLIMDAPTIDAEPVRHGRWLRHCFDPNGRWYEGECSNCGCLPREDERNSPYKFCPKCGAKMDAKEDKPHA